MNVLFNTVGFKEEIDETLELCKIMVDRYNRIGRKEFAFQINGVPGRFHTYYPVPGIKGLEMFFANIPENRQEQIEEIGSEIFDDPYHTTINASMEASSNGLHLTNILNQRFINALHLNLKNYAGISIKSNTKKMEIVSGLHGIHQITAINHNMLGVKSISQLREEIISDIDDLQFLSGDAKIANKRKKFPMPLKAGDLGWWDVGGVESGASNTFYEKNRKKHYRSRASAGFHTFKGNLSNLFSDEFLNTVQSLDPISSLTLEKDTGASRCTLSVNRDLSSAYEGMTTAKATIRRNLGTIRTFDVSTMPLMVRLLNAAYTSVMENVNLQEAFKEYILNNANSTCICGKKFKDTLKKEIVEIGCHSEKKHLMHRSCRNKWVKKHPPKEFKWMESFCPFCGQDSSVYHTPWKYRKLAWANIGP